MRRLQPLLIALSLGSSASATALEWTQAGAGLASTATQSAIAGQGYTSDLAQGGGFRLQSGFLAHRVFHLNAPFVVAPIEDRSVGAGFTPIRIALGGVFADLDGDTLRFAHSATGASAQGRIENDTLLLTWVSGTSGTTGFTIVATDGTDSAQTSFDLEIKSSTAVSPRSSPRTKDTRLDVRVGKTLARTARGTSDGKLEPGNPCEDGSCLSLDILLAGPSTFSVHIYDNLGTSVMSWSQRVDAGTFARLHPDTSGHRPLTIVWNLRNRSGHPVSSGVYLWRIEVQSADGQRMEVIRRLGVKDED